MNILIYILISGMGFLIPQQSFAANPTVTLLTSTGGRVDWSPQNIIAFDRLSSNGYFDIWTMEPDGSNQVCLTCSKPGAPVKHKGNPAWHPSGNYIVFQAEYDNAPNAIDGLADPGAGVDNDLWIMDATGTNYWKIVDTQNVSSANGVLHPHFSYDGTKLFWAQLVKADGAHGDWQLHIADFSVQNGVPVVSNITTLYQPLGASAFYESHGFTPDGTQVIFTGSLESNSSVGNEYLMNPTTNQYVNLTNDTNAWNEHGQINPVNGTIAWASSRGMPTGATLNIWLMNIDGSNQHESINFHDSTQPYYTSGTGSADSSWSPDGTKLVVYSIIDSSVSNPQGSIYLVDFGSPTLGDVNGDGQVTVYDAYMVAQYAVGLIDLTPAQMQEAEVSSSTEINPTIYDAYLIAQYAVGLITQFPAQS